VVSATYVSVCVTYPSINPAFYMISSPPPSPSFSHVSLSALTHNKAETKVCIYETHQRASSSEEEKEEEKKEEEAEEEC